MAFERRSASQVCTLTPQRPAWSFRLTSGGLGISAPAAAQPFSRYPYLTLTQAQAASVQAGDVFQLSTSGTLKETTLFTVQQVAAPASGNQTDMVSAAAAGQPDQCGHGHIHPAARPAEMARRDRPRQRAEIRFHLPGRPGAR